VGDKLLILDVGSTALKAVLYDRTGAAVASAARPLTTQTRSDGSVTVVVADDGIGGAAANGGGGLRGLADRVEALSGRLRVESAAGAGTRVIAEIPLAARADNRT